MSTSSLHFHVESDQTLIAREAPTRRVVEVVIKAPEASVEAQQRIPLNLALVLDRSGSMSGEKLHYVKRAAAYLIETLAETDQLTLVVYDDHVDVLSPGFPLTPAHRERLMRELSRVESRGSTNLAGGWLAGCEMVARAATQAHLNRVLLLTDGLANVGITDPEELAHHAHELARRGISTSTFGVGLGFNEHLLERMATEGDGNFHFIESPQDIPHLFAREFKELLKITAREIELTVDIPTGVTVNVCGGWRHTLEDGRLRLAVGSLAAGRKQELYLEVTTPSATDVTDLKLAFMVRARDEANGILEARADLGFIYATQDEVAAGPRNQDVLARFAKVALADASLEAMRLEREGRRSEARASLLRRFSQVGDAVDTRTRTDYEQFIQHVEEGLEEDERKRILQQRHVERRRREDWDWD
jgi:Ca-activated chloride channel family protein